VPVIIFLQSCAAYYPLADVFIMLTVLFHYFSSMSMMVSGKVILKVLLKVQKYRSYEVPLKVMELCVGTEVITVDQLVTHITDVLNPYTHTVCVYIYAQIHLFVIYLNSDACAYLTITKEN